MKKQLLTSLILVSVLTGCPQEDTTWPDPVPEALGQLDYACCEDQLHALSFNYAKAAQQATEGNTEALHKLLEAPLEMDLPTSYVHGALLASVLIKIKDEPFANTVIALDSKLNSPHPIFQEPLRATLRNMLEGGFQFQTGQQSLKDFPATAKILAYNVE